MNQDFGKQGNSRDLAVLEIGGIQQPKCTDFVTRPTRSVCAFTWSPSVPPSLHPNLCRQLLGAMPKNIATPGPRNCSQVTGLTFSPLFGLKSIGSLLRVSSCTHQCVVRTVRTHYICFLFMSRTSESFNIIVLPLLHALYLEYVFRVLVKSRVEEILRDNGEQLFKDNQKWT